MANGFHIDGDGNLWIGSTSTTFTTTAPFYVETDGTIHAEQGDIGGLEIGDTYIQSTNYSSTNSTGYRLQSDGNVVFYGTLLADDATISGTITATDGTIGGISINTSDIQSTNYSAGTTGFLIESDGDAFFNSVTANNPIITIGKDTSTGTPTTASSDRIKIGDAVLFNRDVSSTSSLVSTKSFLVLPDGDEDNPSLAIDGQYGTLGFFVDTPLTGISRMQITNGTDNVASWATNDSAFTVPDKLVLGGTLSAGGGTGTSGQVLQSTGNGVQWASSSSHSHTGYTFPNSGELLSTNNHSHSGLLDGNHLLANNPHSVYVQNANHSHSNFLESADLSSYATNTALSGKLDVSHSMNVYDHSAFLTSNNLPNNVLTNDNHTSHSGFLSVNHAVNSYDHSAFVTQNNIDFGNHNHNVASHNHAYSSIGHGHDYASSGHNHSYAASSHNHDYAASSHNHAYSSIGHGHDYASTNHNHSYAASSHTHNYASISHYHSGNQTINAWMHDDRFLSVNANSVPGLNVIKRLNPVTANFNEGYVDRLIASNPDVNYRKSFSSMKRKTFRITAQDVEQALTDDGIDTNDVAWLVDRLYYVDPWLADEPAEKQAHGAKGLMNGEFEAVLVQAIKDLSAKIDLLEDRIATLEG